MSSIYEQRPKLGAADFDHWRSRYRSTSYEDQVKYHDWVWKDYPEQRHYNLEAATLFFQSIPQPRRVLEIGGWTGDVANHILRAKAYDGAKDKRFRSIALWTNIEICRGAAARPVCKDFRYEPRVLDCWVWEMPEDWFKPYDVVFMSHSIEHMSSEDVTKLLSRITSARYLYIDAPLAWSGTDWQGYMGTHILRWGWQALLEELAKHGWEQVFDMDTTRMFRRYGA